jgi:hypothetical protein
MIQYLTNQTGNKTAVLVPYKDWEKINARYALLEKKIAILTGIKNGLEEVKAAKKTGKKLQSLSSFLDEYRS